MNRRVIAAIVVLLHVTAAHVAYGESKRIARIYFFGQEGFDVVAIKAALPFREGSAVSFGNDDRDAEALADRWKQDVKRAVKQIVGHEPTDVTPLCCTESGDLVVYIGLPGTSSHPIRYNNPPTRTIKLPERLLNLDAQVDSLLFKAVSEGRAGEDDSQGYALSEDDPELRRKQLEFRDEARQNEATVFKVSDTSADSEQRSIAATALGYLPQTTRQIAALVKASFDPDEGVRNNAVRALGVLLSAKPSVARDIPTGKFISLLKSGTWTDRNKALMVFMQLTAQRDPKLLDDLRSQALTPLVEAARWDKGHAISARVILGRVAGIDEQKLWPLAAEESPDAILNALKPERR